MEKKKKNSVFGFPAVLQDRVFTGWHCVDCKNYLAAVDLFLSLGYGGFFFF